MTISDEQASRIEEKLDALVTEGRDTNSRVRTLEANAGLMSESVISVMKRTTALEERVANGENGLPHMRPPSVSLTTEVASKVSASMAPSLRDAMRPNTVSNIASGVVIALAIIAYAIFGHH